MLERTLKGLQKIIANFNNKAKDKIIKTNLLKGQGNQDTEFLSRKKYARIGKRGKRKLLELGENQNENWSSEEITHPPVIQGSTSEEDVEKITASRNELRLLVLKYPNLKSSVNLAETF